MRSLSPKLTTFAMSLALALAGCGLISSDISKLTFDLPTQTYTFDTSMWGNLPSGTVPAVPCTSDNDCCTAATLAGMSCTSPMLDCNAGTCEASVPESVWSQINLAMDVPSLSSFGGKALSDVTISKITYSVSNNTMNIDLPSMTIYLAPQDVTDPTSPRAVVFGTTMPIPAMTDPTNQSVMLVSNASAIFTMFTTNPNISTPFNIIAATTVKIEAGQPIPKGAVTLSVTGSLSAQI